MNDLLLIAGSRNPVMADFVRHIGQHEERQLAVVSTRDVCRRIGERAKSYPAVGFTKAGFLAVQAADRVSTVVVFLPRRLTAGERSLLDTIAEIAHEKRVRRVCLISSFLVHFGDKRAAEVEAYALERLRVLRTRTALFRPSHILSQHSSVSKHLRSLAFCAPLVPKRMKSCFIAGHEFFEAIEREMDASQPRKLQIYTLLGPNRPWKAQLWENRGSGLFWGILAAGAALMSQLFIGQVLGLLIDLFGKVLPRLRSWNFDTLVPASTQELLALYNRYNFRHVKIVGYNNGVVHFGQRYPGKTIVSTARCNRLARIYGSVAKFDGGVTIRQATDVLRCAGKELYVIPNYSYVTLGTSFFVPIHGSASEYSTLGDTIVKAVLYDPSKEHFIVTSRHQAAFRHYFYNPEADVVLLRLYIRVKEKCSYYRQQFTLTRPTSQEVLRAFQDDQASNVEIRKSRASDTRVLVYKYYARSIPNGTEALELPRDSVGSLWDKLETNPLAKALFHGLMRHLGYHVELFLAADEFATFWDTHSRLPIAKIQLRQIKRDAFPHSPFREHDAISADLFMLRKHRHTFAKYVKETFREIQFNPGKHSM
jgi:hypothetical protein